MLDKHRTAYSDSAGSVVTRETTVSRMTEWFRLQKERHKTISVGNIPKLVMKQRRQESMSDGQTDRKCIRQEDRQIDTIDRQTQKKTERQTDRQKKTDTQTNRQTDKPAEWRELWRHSSDKR